MALTWIDIPDVIGFEMYTVATASTGNQRFSASVTRERNSERYQAWFCDGEHKHSEQFNDLRGARDYVDGLALAFIRSENAIP